mgnify:CR=1 FL=1
MGDEGGFAPNLKSNEEALEVVMEAITAAGYTPGEQVSITLDPAMSELWDEKKGKYVMKKSKSGEYTPAEMVDFWAGLCAKYPIISIEDGMAEDDWDVPKPQEPWQSFGAGARYGTLLHDLLQWQAERDWPLAQGLEGPEWRALMERQPLLTDAERALLSPWLRAITVTPLPLAGASDVVLGSLKTADTTPSRPYIAPQHSFGYVSTPCARIPSPTDFLSVTAISEPPPGADPRSVRRGTFRRRHKRW